MRRLVSLPWATFFGSLFVVLTAVGLVGNTIVIVAISGDRKMRKSVMNMLLLNLAVADALNLFTTMAEWTNTIIVGRPEWILPDLLCPVARYFECVFLFASIFTQLIVCVERYIAIVYPIHARRLCSRTNILFLVGLSWLFVATFALPYALLNEKSPKSRTCHNFFMGTAFWTNYKWAEFFTFYLGPFVIFIVLYSKVSCVLWAKNRQLYEGVSNTTSEVSQRSEALAMRRNVVKMLVACVCVYFICYSPIQGIFLSKVLFNVSVHPPYEFILLMNALAMTCSACNPLLYTLFSKRFRARMAKLLLCRTPNAETNPRKDITNNSFTKVPFRERCGSTWDYVQGVLIIGRSPTPSVSKK
ncbi:hypothetical protein QR680_012592 [Steinernema hermaphroditum]|uniref:G-protein coupled receptors family 1 profile domain-containing protein n=1 Tax=Steinernema hermaphroditum TaxID=289476 RepID=A0AA39I5A1_9BILA|nr:hypothetical protein QR680_012592 [Steinernema hermaphroditum]